MKSVIINQNDACQRLDKFLSKYLPSLPQSMMYKGIRKKRIKINGKRAQINQILCVGDVVDMYINDEFFLRQDTDEPYKTLKPSLNIVYEDENIILMDKPPGMIVHEDDGEKVNTLINHMKAYLFHKGEWNPDDENSFVPALCNRIDRNTAGIVIGAKNAMSLRIINEKIKKREIKKYYLCLVMGHIEQTSGTLEGYLEKDSEKNRVYIHGKPSKNTKTIRTRYRVLRKNTLTDLVEVELLTGRTHQIRAHFASIGHPLAGDGKYGTNELNKKIGMKTQALYSYKLQFDFSDENELSYLNGKVFKVKNVPFADINC